MLQNQLDRTALLDAAKEIIDSFNPVRESDRAIFQRGLKLYRDGSVYNVISEFGTIEANVSDEEKTAFVFLDLNEPANHTCDCPLESYCEHMIATLFYCGSVSGGIGDVLDVWKQKERLDSALTHVRKASSLLKKKETQENDIKDWYEYFHQRYEDKATGNPYMVYQIFHTFYQRMLAERPKENGLDDLFCVNAALFSVEKLITEKKQGYSHSTYMIQQRIQEFISEIEAIPATNDVLDKSHLKFLEDTRNQVVHLLGLDEHYFPALYTIYQLVWSLHLQKDFLIEEHIQSIQADLAKGVRSDQLHYELAHLYFLQGNDEATIQQLEKLESFDMEIVLAWALMTAEQEQWDRLTNWLNFCHHLLKEEMEKGRLMQSLIRTYLQIYEQFTYQIGIEGFEQSLQTFLPYSFYFYCDHLLDQKDFKGWAELHMLLNRDPFVDKEAIKYIEKHQRTILIPLYHHHIEEHIREKNRKHYKMAVRYLKKLRAIYKKEKKVDLWEQYIEILTQTYSRLRAFQEELQKGKIVI